MISGLTSLTPGPPEAAPLKAAKALAGAAGGGMVVAFVVAWPALGSGSQYVDDQGSSPVVRSKLSVTY